MRRIFPNLKHALICATMLAVAVLLSTPVMEAAIVQGDAASPEKVTINVETPGSLGLDLTTVKSTVEELTVTGTINAEDFEAMWTTSYYFKLHTVDLGNASIEGNAIPADAFYNRSVQGHGYGPYLVGWPRLKKIILPEGVESIGQYAFCCCNELSEIILPQSLKSIEDYAFDWARGLDSIDLPSGLESIGVCAFLWSSLKHAELPASLKSIGTEAFYWAQISGTLTIPGTCELGDRVFYGTKIEKLEIEEGFTVLPRNTFCMCEYLEEIKLPSTLREIGFQALSCFGTSLMDIIIPEGVERLEERSLANNCFTKFFSLPSTLTYLGTETFESASEAEAICCKAPMPPECGIHEFSGNTPFQAFTGGSSVSPEVPLYVPTGSGELYRADPYWGYFVNIIETDEFPESGLEEAAVVRPAADGTIFNLQGMPVTNPQPGQIYIVNGKKVLL